MARRTQTTPVFHLDGDVISERQEVLCVESPLQILVRHGAQGSPQPLTITMRTPAETRIQRDEDDADLALGFLVGEGIIHSPSEVLAVESPQGDDSVLVTLAQSVRLPTARLERSFFSTSACGVCGKSTLAGLAAEPQEPVQPQIPQIAASDLFSLPEIVRQAQSTFERTGGLHAAALFDERLQLVALREDVGRHNAVDKLIGSRLRVGALPLHRHLLVVSGRASFELVQKARMACIPIFVAIGAPSSLATEVAKQAGMTLVAFLRQKKLNVYCGVERLRKGNAPLVQDPEPDKEDDEACRLPPSPQPGRRLPMIQAK
ncbi:MAG TPA: formate dehydrogenase accessory sulfurtransferase FdhD [Pseudomonadota bacterium]|nr:formate dehydrogenase accessory sulfurtransferase FdhD [Pseudomonadota bacterium]HNN51291.1 formate dehydrogenase accessory sulfurtransferase FdhD [Pseudomonadota bacterium]